MHTKNGLIEKSIEEFKNRRLGVYKADPDQVVRDTRVAERATKDHVGRWLFELLQNSEDAKAPEVRIAIDKETVYVADNGQGLRPKAVSAICGTDLSDKTAGTIGRKGVGFKSVYEVSDNPQVLTVDEGGIEFSREKTKNWLKDNGLVDGSVPYQWIPFFISWDEARQQDTLLDNFKEKGFKTVVRLPSVRQENIQKVEALLKEWPPHALFTFRHLQRITGPGLEIEVPRSAEDNLWSLRDSRRLFPTKWQVAIHNENPFASLLKGLGSDERKAISKDGVSFLIAAPFENGCAVPTSDYLPVHVFYPTEQKGPVRLLLHAEFLVKSDRTALLPIDDSPFNTWVADRLAHHVCKFVNDSYCPESPSSHIALLVPFDQRESHPVANAIWQRIAQHAKRVLQLAAHEANKWLTVDEARLLSVSVRADLARTLLEATSIGGQLLHPAFDDDKEACKALKELGCKEIHDHDLLEAIAENADSLTTDKQWVWTCWEWLAAWVAEKPYGEENKKRFERAKSLPVVPVNGSLVRLSDLAGQIVTWRPDASVNNLPDWLPLTFVDDWFRNRIRNEADRDSPVKNLSKRLEIAEPGENAIQRAVGLAIKQYWKNKQGDPGRFLRFILDQDWHETNKVSETLKRCPVPLAQPVSGKRWAEAEKTYFGREWGNDLLADLYNSVMRVAWVANDGMPIDSDQQHRVLEWLGVAKCPRILEERGPISVWQLPEDCGQWRRYLEKEKDPDGRRVRRINTVSRIDRLDLDKLDEGRSVLIIRLLAKHWEAYYRNCAEVTAKGTRGREQYYRAWPAKAKWWWEILERLPLPRRGGGDGHIALTKLFLPDKRTERAIGNLLPVIDLDAFGNDKDVVRDWLIDVVKLRTRMDQLEVEEWKDLLSNQTPGKATTKRLGLEERLRDKVTGWYAACLETLAEQENVLPKAFVSCPLLCRRGKEWDYITKEPRYLEDDNDIAKAFSEDVWLFHIPARLAADAVKYLGVRPLSEAVEVQVTAGEPKSPLSDRLLVRLNESFPYVWAWRSSQSKQDAERLSARLKGLKVQVVPALKASLSLDGVHHEAVKRWHVTDDTIFLHGDHANEAELAQALAKALDVRSEADFYENLLRCENDDQRKMKLLSKGMLDAEVDRCLREYLERPNEEEQEQKDEKKQKGPSERPKEEAQEGTSSPQVTDSGIGTQENSSPDRQQANKTTEEHAMEDSEGKEPLRLKDADTVGYNIGGPPERGVGPSGGGGGGGTGQEGHSLTEEEKAELEEAGRRIAARELAKLGYAVEGMPQKNPGFDLRARKGGEELRVEVKAHLGRATMVDVTQREYKEYLGQQVYRWELWNVEHLAENDTDPVAITRYDDIPDDALDTRTFRVDLKKCQRKLKD